MSAAPSTSLQREVLRSVAIVSRDHLRDLDAVEAGVPPLWVTTAELSAAVDRVGQVVGHSAGELMRKGLLRRVARATYMLTGPGLIWLRQEAEEAELTAQHALERAEAEYREEA